ncbi:MAG: alpha/beta fold hydrolase [Acidobacteria bacterium]|nr:MAG: alpha/beta fold hydrolase [Acidobacteriota bacterium]
MTTLVLAHGAGAGSSHPWMKRVAAGLAERGVQVVLFDFRYIAEGRSVPDRAPVLEATWREVWSGVMARAAGPVFAGGKSMGGRIASMVAAHAAPNGFDPPPAGLVFFGYPLHPPAKPEQRRDAHLSSIRVPMLFLHGTRDPFGSPEEMEPLVASLPRATLRLCDHGDHSLVAPKKLDPKGALLESAMDFAAEWMATRAR